MTDRYPLLKFLAFAAVCIGFAAWLVAVIGNISFEDRTSYSGVFEDVSGLLVNDAVKISGVTVGKVEGIEVIDGGRARVRFSVRSDIPLTDDTTLEIRWRDVLGLRFLYVHPGSGAPVDAGHEFPIEQTTGPADIGLLLERLTPVMRALDPEQGNQVLRALAEALGPRVTEVRELIAEGASLTQALAERDTQIARLLENSAVVLDAYARREQQLRELLDSFAEVSETIAARNDTLEQAVVALADQQAELRRFFEANDAEIRRALDTLDEIVAILAFNHDNLDRILRTSGRGFVAYHLISRLGQWFNIRGVGASSNEEVISSERGASLPPKQGGATSASLSRVFGSAARALEGVG